MNDELYDERGIKIFNVKMACHILWVARQK
jgi:hypothetical protein